MNQDYFQSVFGHLAQLPPAENLSRLSVQTILGVSTAFLLVLTLWLSLHGHRKVSVYFEKKEVFLPLVSSWSKVEFYYSLWLLSILRTGFFMLATLPAMFLVYVSSVPEETLHEFMGAGIHFVLWISAIVSGVGALAVVTSAADVHHRQVSSSIWYRLAPMVCFIFGTAIWLFTLFSAGEASGALRCFVSSLPLFGFSPVVLSPLLRLNPSILAVHTLMSSVLALVVLRLYFRWSLVPVPQQPEK